ncbi:hypothetical protein O3M35_012635 [Rhynocoris fuscipes]|uniref:Odorant receptor n=1 Tax=Rhynocoris fuscipes TaxID=488301 RepID=A0AAW1CVK2_9HEMI
MEGKRDLSDVVLLLTIFGVINTNKGLWGKILSVIQLVRLIVVLTGCIVCNVSVYLTGIKDSVPRFGIFCTFGIITSLQATHFWLERHGITETVFNLKSLVLKRNEPKHKMLFKRLSKLGWLAICGLTSTFLIILFFYFIVPLFYDTYLAIFTDSIETFSLPIPYDGILGTKHPRRSLLYYSIVIYISIWVHCSALASLGYFTLLYIFVAYMCCEMRIMSENISDWGELWKQFGTTNETISSLKTIIRDHQELLRLATGLRDALGLPSLVYSILGPMNITLHSYTILVLIEKDFTLLVINIVALITWVYALLFCCVVGEILQMQSLKFYESLCEIPWYEMPSSIRRELNLIMFYSIKPVAIHYKGYGYLNLHLFMEVMSTIS